MNRRSAPLEKAVSRKVENRGISLGVVEEMVAKELHGRHARRAAARHHQGRERGAAYGRGRESDRRGAGRGHLFCQVRGQPRPVRGQIAALYARGKPHVPRHAGDRHGEALQWVNENSFSIRGGVGWGMLVMALVIYLFFPYQKALKIALQNVAGNGRAAVSMEGVTMKLMGIKASKILFRPDASTGQTAPFELSKVDIFWNPLSLVKGKVTIYSKAALYEGTLRCTVEGIPFIGPSDPNISLKLDHVNIGKCPEGALPWFKGMSGTLDGVIRKETPIGRPDKETGVFRLSIRDGEIKGPSGKKHAAADHPLQGDRRRGENRRAEAQHQQARPYERRDCALGRGRGAIGRGRPRHRHEALLSGALQVFPFAGERHYYGKRKPGGAGCRHLGRAEAEKPAGADARRQHTE